MAVAEVPACLYYCNAGLFVDSRLAVNRLYNFDSGTVLGDAHNYEVEALGAMMICGDRAVPTVELASPPTPVGSGCWGRPRGMFHWRSR